MIREELEIFILNQSLLFKVKLALIISKNFILSLFFEH